MRGDYFSISDASSNAMHARPCSDLACNSQSSCVLVEQMIPSVESMTLKQELELPRAELENYPMNLLVHC